MCRNFLDSSLSSPPVLVVEEVAVPKLCPHWLHAELSPVSPGHPELKNIHVWLVLSLYAWFLRLF